MKAGSRLGRTVGWLMVVIVFLLPHPGTGGGALQAQAAPEVPSLPTAGTAGVRHLSIPAAAFSPGAQYFGYENHGRFLKHVDGPPGVETGFYVAPVLLPQSARLGKFTLHFRDMGAGEAIADLVRHTHDTQGGILMAEVTSTDTWTPGYGSVSTTNFNPTADIDNDLYAYYVVLSLPPGAQVWACAIDIEFVPPAAPPASGRVSVPPAAFAPFEDGYGYQNSGWNLVHNSGAATAAARGWYLAPVHLPDGATVTRMVFHWLRDSTSEVGTARLQRTLLGADTYEDMAVASSAAGTGVLMSSTADTTISGAGIDNKTYAYWLILDLPAAGQPASRVEARAVDIQFQYPTGSSKNALALPAAAFRSYEDGYDYENHGRHLLHKHGPSGSLGNGWYMAPLSLPDGVTLTKMTFRWYRNGTYTGLAKLQRTRLGEGTYEDLATATAPQGSALNGSSYDSTIAGGPVDNARYAYWLVWDLPANATTTTGVHGQAVVIEYSYRTFLPLIRRQ